MPFIETESPAEAQGPVRDMYERQQAAFGYVPNYAKVFSHRPELMGRWASLLAGIRHSIEPRRFELVTLAAARALRSSYCSLAHGKALADFFTYAELQAIVGDDMRGPLTEGETAMMAFAAKVATDASRVTAGDVAQLKVHGFADEEIFDIVAAAAARSFFTKVLDGLGAEPDAVYQEMDEPLRKALTVGRPIGFRPPEQVGDDAEAPGVE